MASSKDSGGKIPPKPLPPPPPGEKPPVYSKEEMDAHIEYSKIQIAKLEANFKMEDLETILKEVKAPSLKGALQVNHILLNISALKASNDAKETPKIMKITLQFKTRKKQWRAIRNHLSVVHKAQAAQLIWFEERPYYGHEAIDHCKNMISKLEATANAMDDLAPYLGIFTGRDRGQHGPSALRSVALAAEIFVRLSKAYREIGVGDISASKRYEIVKRCMAKAGETVTFEAVKTAITNHLKEYPPAEEHR
jgi:hypothetical protein